MDTDMHTEKMLCRHREEMANHMPSREAGSRFSLTASEAAIPAHALVLDFWAPEP